MNRARISLQTLLMLLALAAAALLCVVGPASAAVQEAYCRAVLPRTQLGVRVSLEVPQIRHELPEHKMRDLLGARAEDGHVLGLTRATPGQRSSLSLASAWVPGGVCVRPAIDIELTLTDFRVDIGGAYPVDSCIYAETLRHEMRHVRAHEHSLRRARALLLAQLQRRYDDDPVFLFESLDSAKRDIEKGLSETLVPLVSSALNQVQQDQARIDTHAEYLRLTFACGAREPAGSHPHQHEASRRPGAELPAAG